MAEKNVDGYMTSAINHYDGIFKFLHVKEAQEHFLRARGLLARNKWSEAIAAFQEAKENAASDIHDIATIDLILHEMEHYKQNLIPADVAPKDVNWTDVSRRSLSRHDEASDRLPQGVFFLTVGSRRLVGVKTLSSKWLNNKIPELYCSLVRPDMLLGLFADQRVTDTKVILHYHPLDKAEKLKVFQEIYDDDGLCAELVFPFPLLKTHTRKEFTSPAEGWQVDNVYDDMLSNGEVHVRQYSIRFLTSLKLDKPRLYDPACSTGIFLSTIQRALPQVYTIGQDLSKQMADVSRQRLNEAHHGNALEPKIQLGSAKMVFIRFLNSEVVTSAEAEILLEPLLTTVAVGGLFVVFGHTPVLLSAANFRCLSNFQLDRCVAVSVEKDGIFQYYVLTRTK